MVSFCSASEGNASVSSGMVTDPSGPHTLQNVYVGKAVIVGRGVTVGLHVTVGANVLLPLSLLLLPPVGVDGAGVVVVATAATGRGVVEDELVLVTTG